MTDWSAFTTPGADEPVDHEKLLGNKDSKFLAAMTEFEKVAPELEKAMTAPRFVAPETHFSFSTVVMNFIAVRSSAMAMVGLAELRLAQGRPADAFRALMAPIHMSGNLRAQGPLITDMVGLAIGTLSMDAFTSLIHPRFPIPVADWKRAAGIFSAAVPPKDRVLTAAQMEVTAANTSFEETAESKAVDPYLGALKRAPGMLRREQRIYNNIMGDMLLDLKENRPPVVEEVGTPGSLDFLTGKVGLALDLVPNMTRMQPFAEHNRRRVIGLSVFCGVAAYLAENKALPKDLEQVRGVAEIPDSAILTEVGVTYKLEGTQATLTVPQARDMTIDITDEQDFGPHPWYKQDKSAMVWSF
jgi:hypothetical protein